MSAAGRWFLFLVLIAVHWIGFQILRIRVARAEQIGIWSGEWYRPKSLLGKKWRNATLLWLVGGALGLICYGVFGYARVRL
jgi:hypothetical protein